MSNNQDKLKRFQVIKVEANAVGDNTKPTRFVISIENKNEKPTILVAEQYTLSFNGKDTNAMTRKRKGYVKKLYTNSKSRKVGVGVDMYEIDKKVIKSTGKIYSGRNKRRILNQVYNKKDKKSKEIERIVQRNRHKRKKYKKGA